MPTKKEIVQQLRDAQFECSIPNWNGYNADPITEQTLSLAVKLVELLDREGVPMPTGVEAQPSGALALKWYVRAQWMIAACFYCPSLTAPCKVDWVCWLAGSVKTGESDTLDSIPPELRELIEQWAKGVDSFS